MFNNLYYFIYGRRASGCFNIRNIDGKDSRDISYKKLKLSRSKRFMIQIENSINNVDNNTSNELQ